MRGDTSGITDEFRKACAHYEIFFLRSVHPPNLHLTKPPVSDTLFLVAVSHLERAEARRYKGFIHKVRQEGIQFPGTGRVCFYCSKKYIYGRYGLWHVFWCR